MSRVKNCLVNDCHDSSMTKIYVDFFKIGNVINIVFDCLSNISNYQYYGDVLSFW